MFSLLGVFYKSLLPNLKFTTASHTSCVPTDSLWHTVKPCAMSYAAITLQLLGGGGGALLYPLLGHYQVLPCYTIMVMMEHYYVSGTLVILGHGLVQP